MKRILSLLTGLCIATLIIASDALPFTPEQDTPKAKIKGTEVERNLIRAIEIADSIIELQGFLESVDDGEYKELKNSISKGRKLLTSENTVASVAIAKTNEITSLTAQYRKQYPYLLIDSISNIPEDENIIFSDGSDGWKIGTYPIEFSERLIKFIDNASTRADKVKTLAEINSLIVEIENELKAFYASGVDKTYRLPLRFNEKDGLPGERENGAIDGSFIWNTPIIYLKEPVSILRLTATKEIANTTFNGTAIFCLAEFEIYDAAGNLIPLREEMFEYNSLCTSDGGGIKALIDGKHNTYYHSAYKNSHEAVPASGEYAYIQVILDEPLTAFRYRFVSRASENYSRAPVDFGFTNGEEYNPDNVPEQDPYDLQVVKKLNSVSQIAAGKHYILYGNMNKYDNDGETTISHGSGYYAGTKLYNHKVPTSSCLVTFEDAGNGKYYIHNISQNTYIQQPRTWESANSTYFKKEAAAFVIREYEPHMYAFNIYSQGIIDDEYNEYHGQEVIFPLQDWNGEMGTRPYSNVATYKNFELDGRNEWDIYEVSVENYDKMMLESTLSSITKLGFTPESFGENPGQYSGEGVEEFFTAMITAQAILDTKNFAAIKKAAENLQTNIEALSTLDVNPIIVGGEYHIVSAYSNFYDNQKREMAIYAAANDNSNPEITSIDQPYWGTFGAEESANKDEYTWIVEEGDVTNIDIIPGNTYVYLKNKATGEYLGAARNLGTPLPMSQSPSLYFFKTAGGYKFNIGSHEAQNSFIENSYTHNYLHTLGHDEGKAKSGHICLWHYNVGQSRWKLLNVATTSISNITEEETEGEILHTTYYSIDGKMHETPIKGINIVKTIYSNGTVKTKKIFVK